MTIASTIRTVLAASMLTLAAFLPAHGAEGGQSALTPAQEKAVEGVVHDYLLKNPELIIQVMQELQKRDEAQRQNQVKTVLSHTKKMVERDPTSPVLGNPKGDVTVVEFFDYRCPYCKQVFPATQKLIKSDPNLRYVLKEFPILTPESLIAAKAAEAVWLHQSTKYAPFHAAMMLSRGGLSEAKIFDLAAKSGVDVAKMKVDMNAKDVAKAIDDNHRLAQSLNITGTPTFIIGQDLTSGALSIDELRAKIAAARKQAKTAH